MRGQARTSAEEGARPLRSRGAFTLIELLVVMVVVAAAGVMVVPRLAGSRARGRVLAQARTVATLAQAARARAASEGRTYLLIIDPEQGEARLARRRDPLAEATDEDDPEREPADAAASWSRGVAFEDGVTLVEPLPSSLDGALSIAFRPHGDADAAHVVFASADGADRIAVVVDAAQGRCTIDETGASAPEDAP
jgi:prepilin-type N-terminal cleavage/methylation domain-containing protein